MIRLTPNCHGLGRVALAGAGLANDQCVGALGNELEREQLEAGRATQLGIELPIEVGQGGPLVQARAELTSSLQSYLQQVAKQST